MKTVYERRKDHKEGHPGYFYQEAIVEKQCRDKCDDLGTSGCKGINWCCKLFPFILLPNQGLVWGSQYMS